MEVLILKLERNNDMTMHHHRLLDLCINCLEISYGGVCQRREPNRTEREADHGGNNGDG